VLVALAALLPRATEARRATTEVARRDERRPLHLRDAERQRQPADPAHTVVPAPTSRNARVPATRACSRCSTAARWPRSSSRWAHLAEVSTRSARPSSRRTASATRCSSSTSTSSAAGAEEPRDVVRYEPGSPWTPRRFRVPIGQYDSTQRPEPRTARWYGRVGCPSSGSSDVGPRRATTIEALPGLWWFAPTRLPGGTLTTDSSSSSTGT